MLAIAGTAGPGRGAWLFLGLASGKRCGLALARALCLFELSLETVAFDLETGVALLQFRDATFALSATRADRSGHTIQRSGTRCCQLRQYRYEPPINPNWALHKY
jgi:hypothetical protein